MLTPSVPSASLQMIVKLVGVAYKPGSWCYFRDLDSIGEMDQQEPHEIQQRIIPSPAYREK